MKLTKSNFITALVCPTKLFYLADESYNNETAIDPFLELLAEGGYQVGELAKLYFPKGIEITSRNSQSALTETNELLKQNKVTLFEAFIQFENCQVRVDILEQNGDQINLYEVKAKSIDSKEKIGFLRKDGHPTSEWKTYLYDIAFQKWVCQKAFPNSTVSAYLMLVDKSKKTNVPGLNQKFKVIEQDGRKLVKQENLSALDMDGLKILASVNVDHICNQIYSLQDHGLETHITFDGMVQKFSNTCKNNEFTTPTIGSHCGQCEFTTTISKRNKRNLDGRKHCFNTTFGVGNKILVEPNIFELWNFRNKNKLITEGKILLKDIEKSDLNVTSSDVGLSNSERQWLQVKKAKQRDETVYFDEEGLASEMANWKFPLHFIDFETTMIAIPFGANQTPYEGIAFQFSHHIVEANGQVKHAGQFINTEPGYFPNYDFIRTLKDQLYFDNGSVFCYSQHENTYLNLIIQQLQNDKHSPKDADELIKFIKTIAKPAGKITDFWQAERQMIDLLELVKKFYFDPKTHGSNSIKQILPSVLNWSNFLQSKYSQPIYGSITGIPSHNFSNWSWLQTLPDGHIADPYDLLPKLFDDKNDINFNQLTPDSTLKNGGAALMAYARMQFEEISDYERKELSNGLLKYCELDTLAMVMIYEAWCHHLKK